MTVGERMKKRRKEIGMSAEQVAEIINVSPATIYRYENGAIEKMGIDKLDPIAKAIHTTAAYLMGWEDNPAESPPTVDEKQIRAAFFNGYADDLPEEEIDALWNDARDYAKFKASQKKKGSKTIDE